MRRKSGGREWSSIVLRCVVLLTVTKLVGGGKKHGSPTDHKNCKNIRTHNPIPYKHCCQTQGEFYPDEDARCCTAAEASMNSAYCQALHQDVDMTRTDDEGWTRFFTGRDENGNEIDPQWWDVRCNPENPPSFRMAPAVDKLEDFGRSTELYTNRLRFEPQWIAQEGISFCIVGSHYRSTQFAMWEPLLGFLPLAEKSFDIGNHVDPTDSRKLNTFQLPDPDSLRKIIHKGRILTATGDNCWYDKIKLPTSRFRNVWLGVLEVNDDNSGIETNKNPSGTPVTLDWGFAKRPAHPDWMPGKDCRNPYVVTVSMIESDGIYLQNYLHIKVSAEPTTQSGNNCPTGKIKLFMMEVRDQDGLPVGQFTDDVPCDQDTTTKSEKLQCMNAATTCKAHHGTKMNHVPCMFSHPKSVVHPTIFMMAADAYLNTGGTANPPPPPPGGSGGPGPGGAGGLPGASQGFCRNNQDDKQKPVKRKDNANDYVTEVHATWRFAQMDEGWVSELHFATMIVEDETPIQYYTSRLTHWEGVSKTAPAVNEYYNRASSGTRTICDTARGCCWYYGLDCGLRDYRPGRLQLGLINSCLNETYNTNRPYGYSARYTALKPTYKTRGGWDWFRRRYISPRTLNCHASISYGPQFFYEKGDEPGKVPVRKTLKDHLIDKYTLQNKAKYQPPTFPGKERWEKKRWATHNLAKTYELPDWHNPGLTKSTDGKLRVQWYTGLQNPFNPMLKMFDSAHQDPIVLTNELDDKPHREYFGSRYIAPKREQLRPDVTALRTTIEVHDQEFSMKEMALDPKSRCPCPFLPTTPAPEIATKAPVELEARRTHVVNMMIGWIVLVPISFFAARFFKETFARVFFLQEFWWYTLHVLCLLTALLFSFGGIYGMKLKRSYGEAYEYVFTSATQVHYYGGYTTLGLFIVHLILGPFRFIEPHHRVIQIVLHWLFGWLIYMGGIVTILSSAAIPSGIFSCITFGIYVGFLVFQVVATLGMEYHMWQVDHELNMNPPRAYFPSPQMRVFHRDAPHARFRMYMMLLYCLACFFFYVAMHVALKRAGGENSCFQPHEIEAESQSVDI